jgi:hypothetical protein
VPACTSESPISVAMIGTIEYSAERSVLIELRGRGDRGVSTAAAAEASARARLREKANRTYMIEPHIIAYTLYRSDFLLSLMTRRSV